MKNTRELREFLVGQMIKVANGEVDVEMAKGVSNLAQQIYNTINVEVKFATAMQKLDGTEIKAVSFGD
tara:strand:- start:27 stop:230 length:204 start_codon:yes stop_codon:yes gene_type:complete